MARKLPPHIGKIAAAIAAVAVPLIVKAVTDAVQNRLTAKAKESKSLSTGKRKKTKTASKRKKSEGSDGNK